MGTTMPTTGLQTPACSIFAMRRGSAVSEDEVETMSRNSRPRYRSRAIRFRPATSRSSDPRTTTTNRAHVA